MKDENRKANHLIGESSPYLLQHAYNPVDWYPWGEEAFDKAMREDKPVFLSIGYSTCHWCHVMAHESFEDEEVADVMNRWFVAVKVDREERPDIDSIYMTVCQTLTGSGGWPTSLFLTPEKKPFFAGTYFPKRTMNQMTGLIELLTAVHRKWEKERSDLILAAESILTALGQQDEIGQQDKIGQQDEIGLQDGIGQQDGIGHKDGNEYRQEKWTDAKVMVNTAFQQFRQSFDTQYFGFGRAPKFPAAHNLMFLLAFYGKTGEKEALSMVEKTLMQMYRGGLFDHIGYGFCRYSTDRYFLVPHFEKMLYDNALLIMAYSQAYGMSGKTVYREIAEKTAEYILREMTSSEGSFYSAQDADSEGIEGKYYVFEPEEIIALLGEERGRAFNREYGITKEGNFEGKSIPNRIKSLSGKAFDDCLPVIREYRNQRSRLHLDDKQLTSWNSLMIAALCQLYRVTGNTTYFKAAKRAQQFIESRLSEGNTLYVSYREGKRSGKGFLDDYAYYCFALIQLYEAGLEIHYLRQAKLMCEKAMDDFFDRKAGGFYFYGREHERLLFRPKESYDGAMPSGNSVMTYNLVRLLMYTGLWEDNGGIRTATEYQDWKTVLEKQKQYMVKEAEQYPAGYSMFLLAILDNIEAPAQVTLIKGKADEPETEISHLPLVVPIGAVIEVRKEKEGRTVYHICANHQCYPPVESLEECSRILKSIKS